MMTSLCYLMCISTIFKTDLHDCSAKSSNCIHRHSVKENRTQIFEAILVLRYHKPVLNDDNTMLFDVYRHHLWQIYGTVVQNLVTAYTDIL